MVQWKTGSQDKNDAHTQRCELSSPSDLSFYFFRYWGL